MGDNLKSLHRTYFVTKTM